MNSKEVGIACRSSVSVLITGPEGSGKTRLARRIHDGGSRRESRFVVSNVEMWTGAFLEFQVHESLRRARKGTLLIEGLGTQSVLNQKAVLRGLRSRQAHYDARLIVEIRISEDQASPLIPELNRWAGELQIRVSAIAEEPEDFDEVLHSCLEEVACASGRPVYRLSEAAALALESHDWPGNFRELRKLLELAVVSSSHGCIELQDIPAWGSLYGDYRKNQLSHPSPEYGQSEQASLV